MCHGLTEEYQKFVEKQEGLYQRAMGEVLIEDHVARDLAIRSAAKSYSDSS
jgi:hypothetical protein